MADDDEAPHASAQPDTIEPGETLTLRIDSPKKAEKVSVVLLEIDSRSPLEGAGPDKELVTFEGKIEDGTFTPSSDPKVHSSDTSLPSIKVVVEGGSPVDVPLPDAKLEHGVFELGLKLTADGKTYAAPGAKDPSADPVMVRMFQHFTAGGEPRPVIAFVTGTEDGFFQAAEDYWKLNADAVVVNKGMSFADVLSTLDALADKYGPWGQINIVAHGNPEHLKMRLFSNSKKEMLHEDLLNNQDILKQLTIPSGIDDETEVFFRSCNAGLNQDLVDTLKQRIFPTAKFLKIPMWPQGYQSQKSKKKGANGQVEVVTTASEFFLEQMHYDRPTQAEAEADLSTELPKRFDDIKNRSPGLDSSASASEELPKFTEKMSLTYEFDDTIKYIEADISDAEGKQLDDDGIIEKYRKDWSPLFQNDTLSSTGKTEETRWKVELASKPKEVQTTENETRRGVTFISKEGTPQLIQFSNGFVSAGTADPSNWKVTGAGVAAFHVQFQLGVSGNMNQVEITHETDDAGKVTEVKAGSQTVRLDENNKKLQATLPITVTIGELPPPDPSAPPSATPPALTGTAKLEVRRGKEFEMGFHSTRFLIARRRKMMKFEAGVEYDKRKVVVQPNSGNDALLFGKA